MLFIAWALVFYGTFLDLTYVAVAVTDGPRAAFEAFSAPLRRPGLYAFLNVALPVVAVLVWATVAFVMFRIRSPRPHAD